MRTALPRILAVLVAATALSASPAGAQDARPLLETVAQAMGAGKLTSIVFSATGTTFAVGQSPVPGAPWPRFDLKSHTRMINYDTASLQVDQVLVRVDPRGGGLPSMGEARQTFAVSGDHAWTGSGTTVFPQPRFRSDLQVQLWASPHGIVKAAIAHGATIQGRTIAFTAPGRFAIRATIDDRHLIDRVEAVVPNQVVGDMAVEIQYADYRDVDGVKFPMRIRQSAGGFSSLDLTVTDVRPNAPVDVQVPESVRQATRPYARVTSQAAADGVWYVTGGTHHSAAIEMADHVVVVEAPLDDERAQAVLGEVRTLVPGKPIRYVINSHHHFDHSGGLRAFAAEGVTVITHETNRAFFERALATPATIAPDALTRSGRRGTVESVRDRRVLTDAHRTVEIHHIADSPHADGMLMVYLPKERFLIQADAFTPPPLAAPLTTAVNPNSVNLADNIARLGLAVDQLLPLHGRIVPLADLHRAIGRAQ